ncbi:MAG: hypothetical protein CME83_01100, partial [Candidatus Heimdallarchaeota archaeon]|nr:hypothetical protein [Candidatus Heimdallarchaeota archaeon]
MRLKFSIIVLLLLIAITPQMSEAISSPINSEISNIKNQSQPRGSEPNWQELNTSSSQPGSTGGNYLVYDSFNKKTILFSQFDSATSRYSNRIHAFDHVTNSWTQHGSHPNQGSGNLVFDPLLKKVIFYGGSSISNGYVTDTHIFDLATNTWEKTANNPGARLNHAMVYDTKNNVTLLYGGKVTIDGLWETFDDTWAFNSQTNNWTKLNPSNKPDVYFHTNHVYDQKHNKFILFGGTDDYGGSWNPVAKGGTWAYDFTLNTWTKLNSTNEPSPRLNGKMFYDPILEKSFLFGGRTGAYDYSNETWSFDYASNVWTQVESDISPSGRSDFGLSYDSDQQVAILHGKASDPTWQFTPQALHSVDGPNQANYQYKSNNASLSLNVTIQNATTYDAYLNNELIETTNYQNGTVNLNLTSIYSNFSYSNFTIINYTKYENTNLTILFNSEENTRLS